MQDFSPGRFFRDLPCNRKVDFSPDRHFKEDFIPTPWTHEKLAPSPPPKINYCGELGCPGHKFNNQRCLSTKPFTPITHKALEPIINSYKCLKIGCTGHPNPGMKCFELASSTLKPIITTYKCLKIGCTGHPNPGMKCFELASSTFKPIITTYRCLKIGCTGHPNPGMMCL